jgi:hypothetical protein
MNGCDTTFVGGVKNDKPLPEGERYRDDDPSVGRGTWTPFKKKPRNLYNTGQAVCGAAGCTRACMISLEARGVLQNKFKDKFRRRKAWKVDWSAEPYPVDYTPPYADADAKASDAD